MKSILNTGKDKKFFEHCALDFIHTYLKNNFTDCCLEPILVHSILFFELGLISGLFY